VLAELEPKAADADDITRRRTELETLKNELQRLTAAIAGGGEHAALLVAVRAQQDALVREMATTEASAHTGRLDRRAIEATVRSKLKTWRTLLTRHVSDARQLLREILDGPVLFTPAGRGYRFEGQINLVGLFAGTVVAPKVASLTGLEAFRSSRSPESFERHDNGLRAVNCLHLRRLGPAARNGAPSAPAVESLSEALL
jgi:hypothetical protein